MGLKVAFHRDARAALTRTQGRRSGSWLIMAACLGTMMLLWGVALPWWVFAGIAATPFIALIVLGNYWAGQDEVAKQREAAARVTVRAATARPAGKPKFKNKPRRHH
jgi:hypothetical protein